MFLIKLPNGMPDEEDKGAHTFLHSMENFFFNLLIWERRFRIKIIFFFEYLKIFVLANFSCFTVMSV